MNIQQLKKQLDELKTKSAIAEADLKRMLGELTTIGVPDLKAAEKEIPKIEKEIATLESEKQSLLKKAEGILTRQTTMIPITSNQ